MGRVSAALRAIRPSGGAPSVASLLLLAAGMAMVVVLFTARDASCVQWPWAHRDDAPTPVYPDVTATPEWLAERLRARDVVVVDTRSADLYSREHLPGAVSIPVDELSAALRAEHRPPELARALAGFGLTGRGRIVCYGEDGTSANAAWLFWALETAGAEGAMLLEGGLHAWASGGGALDAVGAALPPATWTGEPRSDRSASAAYVALKFGEDGHEIIDARGWDDWHGSIDPEEWGQPVRHGHVPHALPYDFTEFFDADGGLITPEDAWEVFSRVGPRPSSPVDMSDEFIVYGAGGADGALGYFLLRRAGVAAVRYYPGGWREWSGDVSLPVVRIIEADELKERLARARRWFKPNAAPQSFAFFDVRHWADYATGHIPGSVTLTSSLFADSLDLYLERSWPGLDRTTAPIVTYCYGSNCIRSRLCSTFSARDGFVNVERFYGGLAEWRAAGGELVRDQALLDRLIRERDEAKAEAERRRAEREAAQGAGGNGQ